MRVDKFETEITLRTVALTEAAKSVETLAVPSTKRFEPVGGLLMVPMDTPFPYATFD